MHMKWLSNWFKMNANFELILQIIEWVLNKVFINKLFPKKYIWYWLKSLYALKFHKNAYYTLMYWGSEISLIKHVLTGICCVLLFINCFFTFNQLFVYIFSCLFSLNQLFVYVFSCLFTFSQLFVDFWSTICLL